MLLGLSIPLWLAAGFSGTKRFVSKKATPILALLVIASLLFSTADLAGRYIVVGVTPNQELSLTLAPLRATGSPASNLYVVNGREQAHISNIINLMGANGLRFYKSVTNGENQGPDGLIAKNDVVLIKINEEWPYRGGTNTDLLKELIQALTNHPEGFTGEIIVADNGQWQGNMNWPQSNAENHAQSTQDVVNQFPQASTYSWIPIRHRRVQEYSQGDLTDGYILYDTPDPETGLKVSYPKFKTQLGTYVSFKQGIWNGTAYEKRLKIINMPVLKSHSSYGVTAALKHYMGVQSQGEGQAGLANGHSSIATGGMGTLLAQTSIPTLNIIDAIWVNANPPGYSGAGPSTPYNMATRVNVILASTDPVAIDYWAARHVLMQTSSLIGYTDTRSIDPDSTEKTGVSGEAFGVWIKLAEEEIADAGYTVTSNENKMNVYLQTETTTIHASISPSSTVMDVGQSKEFTSNVSGGTLPYSLQWYLNGTLIAGATADSWTFTPASPGTNTVYLKVTDALGSNAISPASNIEVSPVIPEFQPRFLLPLLIMATLLAAVVPIWNTKKKKADLG